MKIIQLGELLRLDLIGSKTTLFTYSTSNFLFCVSKIMLRLFTLIMCILCVSVYCFPHQRTLLRERRVSKFTINSKTPASPEKEVTVINEDTKTSIQIAVGSPLSLAAVRSGIRLSFQCKQGSCSSCETFLNGKRTRTCITKVPDMKKITLKKAPKL